METYDTYIEWKGWEDGEFLAYTEQERFQFKKEFGKYLQRRGSILEIGFGNGAVLGILQDDGKSVTGIEINDALIERAKQAGIPAYKYLSEIKNHTFDCILAFDVLEHISASELPSFFITVRNLLSKDGIFIARFPNGDSPFALPTQYGDITHVTPIGWNRIVQLTRSAELQVFEYKGERLHSKSLLVTFVRSCISIIRTIIADVTLRAFYPQMPKGQVTFRAVNMIAIMGRLP